MGIPYRGKTTQSTYFVTANVLQKRSLFQVEKIALLFIRILFDYRAQKKYLLHEFVVMPDHFHLIFTPTGITLERAMQCIKGGFTFQLNRNLKTKRDPWQPSFFDRRIRDSLEYARFKDYIWQNQVRWFAKGAVSMIEKFQLQFGRAPGSAGNLINASAVTVFVGPNNSGKSRVLSEIAQYCSLGTKHANAVILEYLAFTPSPGQEALQAIEHIRQSPGIGEVLSSGIVILGGRGARNHVNLETMIQIMPGAPSFCAEALRFSELRTKGWETMTRRS